LTRPPEPLVEQGAPCPYCGAAAEPEQEGDTLFYACPRCEGAFGYRRVQQPGPVCAAGLTIVADPAQPLGVMTVESGSDRRSVFLGTTIKRRPE
jgi:hypothetical protein